MNLGALEVATLAVLALLVFGPERLPEIARSVGKTIAAVRREARTTLQSLSDEADLAEFRNVASDLRSEAEGLRSAVSLRDSPTRSGRDRSRSRGPAPFDPDAT